MRIVAWWGPSIVAVIVLAVYVLSVGPLVGLNERGFIAGRNLEWMESTHRPIFAAAEQWSIAANTLNWYLGLWRPSRPSSPPRLVTAEELRAIGVDVGTLGENLPPIYAMDGQGWIMPAGSQPAPCKIPSTAGSGK